MKDIKDFQERYNRWKNGERYWDIRGIELPKYDNWKTSIEKKNDFYSWMDKLADKKAQDWTKAPMKPLDPTLVEMQMLNDPTYNYETFYNLQPSVAERMLQADPDAHFTDIAKTIYHPTFSDESIFSGNVSDFNPLGIIGGHWNEIGTEYTPSASQLQNYFNYNVTRDYLDRNEDHPVKINLPKYQTGKNGKNTMNSFITDIGPLVYQGLKSRGVKNPNAYDYMMRQLAMESGYGGTRYRNFHNYGGVMSKGKLKQFESDQQFVDYYLNLMNNKYRDAVSAKDLRQYAEQLGKQGYYNGPTVQQYYDKLNGLKTYGRLLQNDLNKNRNIYEQNSGIQVNPQTNQAQFIQPIPIEQQPAQIPLIKPQDLKMLTVPINQIKIPNLNFK